MPIHDWTRVDAGLFHAFHFMWIANLTHSLNLGGLPPGYFALPEQRNYGSVPDISEPAIYARKADPIAVRHPLGHVIALVEIVSPGNKGSHIEMRAFVEKTADLIRQGVNVLIIDLFPPSKPDPQGIYKAIWDEFVEEEFELLPDKPLTVVSYDAGARVAYVEPVGVGDVLPEMPLFLKPEFYVPAPLEAAYQTTWNFFPAPMRKLLEGPAPPSAAPPGDPSDS